MPTPEELFKLKMREFIRVGYELVDAWDGFNPDGSQWNADATFDAPIVGAPEDMAAVKRGDHIPLFPLSVQDWLDALHAWYFGGED